MDFEENKEEQLNEETSIKKEKLKEIVYKYANLAGVNDKKMIDGLVERLTKLNTNDSIDTILVSLNSLLDRKVLTKEQILSNLDLILALNKDKYNSKDDLISRLNWIKSMNMTYTKMPLAENHKLVIEAFDKLNSLIGTNFDSFYTGGLMGYLSTNKALERYHSDLDLFINEEQLLELYEIIEKSEYFEFESNMEQKGENGHEFNLVYKGTPMSVGLFLFNRLPNQEMVLKQYYYPSQNKTNGLHVNEKHIEKEYANMLFSNKIMNHNGIPYKTQSLEGIYHAKKDSRPKDRHDAKIIESYVDMKIVSKLENNKDKNYNINGILAQNSIVEKLDNIIMQNKLKTDTIQKNISRDTKER